jgi:transcriptional regulator with XRE-family HTH domain
MKLGKWLKTKGLTLDRFGEMIGRDHSSVLRYIRGEQMPNRDTLAKISKATGGEVTANDFVDAFSEADENSAEHQAR